MLEAMTNAATGYVMLVADPTAPRHLVRRERRVAATNPMEGPMSGTPIAGSRITIDRVL